MGSTWMGFQEPEEWVTRGGPGSFQNLSRSAA